MADKGNPVPSTTFSELQLEELRARMAAFASDRDWGQYHTPRNLTLALVGEVGELAEIFQWRGEVAPGLPGFTPREREHLGEELSDVMLYLVRLADVCGVDLAAAALDKIQKNAKKYPAEQCKGRSDKYSAYSGGSGGGGDQGGGGGKSSGGAAE